MRRNLAIVTAESKCSVWNVVVPVFPGCFAWGATVEEALAMARDAIATRLDGEPAADWPAPGETVVAEVKVAIDEVDGLLRAVGAPTAANR